MTVQLNAQLPVPASAPLVMPDGKTIERYWYLLLVSLFNRTGESSGISSAEIQAEAAQALVDAANALTVATNAVAIATSALAVAATSLQKAANLSDLASAAAARNNLGLGSVALGNTQPGWTAPTGTPNRTTFNADATTLVSNPPTQLEVQDIADRLLIVQRHLAALEIDATSAKVIGA